jgi:hypothetical protein
MSWASKVREGSWLGRSSLQQAAAEVDPGRVSRSVGCSFMANLIEMIQARHSPLLFFSWGVGSQNAHPEQLQALSLNKVSGRT